MLAAKAAQKPTPPRPTSPIQHSVPKPRGRASAPPTANMPQGPRRDTERDEALRRVFGAFDLDGVGLVPVVELHELGVARRVLGQRRGVWTEERNDQLMKRP